MSAPLPYFPSLPDAQFDADIAYLEKALADNPENRYAADCLLRILDYYTPSQSGLGVFSDCQREVVARYRGDSWIHELLDIDIAAEHFQFWNSLLDSKGLNPPSLVTQLYAGEVHKIHGEQTNCVLRMSLFLNDGVISRFCDSCFKVQILMQDLTGLIQTYFVLRVLDLPRDNTRKCMVDMRNDIAYPYKGYIYCESEEEVMHCAEVLEGALRSFGLSNIHCGISHGCSEYGLEHPEYKYCKHGKHRAFRRPESWDKKEAVFFEMNELHNEHVDNYNNAGITINDIIGFRAWIHYAEIIGDSTCKRFLGGPTFKMPKRFTRQVEKLAYKRDQQLAELRERFSCTN